MADSSADISSCIEATTSDGSAENFEETDGYPLQVNLPRKPSVLKRDGKHGPKRTLQKSVSFSSRPEEKKIINGEYFQIFDREKYDLWPWPKSWKFVWLIVSFYYFR